MASDAPKSSPNGSAGDPWRPPGRARRLGSSTLRVLSAYARWLDSISWRRFLLLAVLLLVAAGMLEDIPPFSTPWGTDRKVVVQPPTSGSAAPATPSAIVVETKPKAGDKSYRISIDRTGVKVEPVTEDSAAPPAESDRGKLRIDIPPGVLSEAERKEIRRAIEEAGEEIADAVRESGPKTITHRAFRLGDHLMALAMIFIVLSAVMKIMAAGRFKAEARAAAATEQAGEEALKRQVVEARMAAMQAQVEPHFLFNTLASIDHLIETDPPRASRMQKHLIALLRASMPSLRESAAEGGSGVRELARELEVIRPYLEILKVRMEERLAPTIDVPAGLHSALFPPMMIQSLVENAIKHGLEPKPEGGTLTVRAEVIDGRLAVSVADTGLGFGRSATAGTGVGLANIRERLRLLYGSSASLDVRENPGGGTIVTVTVPYAVKPAPSTVATPSGTGPAAYA